MNGGQRKEVEGTWSASLEWLVRRLAPRFPELVFAEVRYRIKSWRRLDWCVADARAAVVETGAPRTLLLGFSMGGAVAVQAAVEPSVESVLGLAPWLPDRLPFEPIRGRNASRFSTAASTAGCRGSLASARGARGAASSALARSASRVTTRSFPARCTGSPCVVGGRLVPLPGAGSWARLVAAELERFQAAGD